MGILDRISSVSKRLTATKDCESLEHKMMEQQLGLAQAQRSLMTVTFQNPALAEKGFVGPCLASDHNSMLIDVARPEKYAAYQGEAVQVCFAIEQAQTATYLRFFSTVRSHTALGEGIALELPTRLLPNQQREFVRIAPAENAVLHLHAWSITDDAVPTTPGAMAAGHARAEDATLVNISVTGLRVRIKKPPEDGASSFDKEARLLCFLQLQPLEKSRNAQQKGPHALELWLTGTVKYYEEENKLSTLLLGINFTAWATPGSEKKSLEWRETDEKGQIPLLYEWVLRQQLLQRVLRH